MRDLVMLGTLLLLLFFASRNAFSAWLLWAWASLVGINDFMYGYMRTVSYVQWFALLALLLVMMRKDPELAPQGQPFGGVRALMVIFAVHGLFVAALAYPGIERNWEIATNIIKVVLLCALMPMVITSRARMQVFIIAVVLALAVQGVIDGLKFLKSGGGHLASGTGRLGDRNDYALHLVLAIPLMIFLITQLKGKLARLAVLGTIVLTILTVVATQSRGALVSMSAVAVWLTLRSGRKLLAMALVAGGAALILTLAPASWFDRMQTINTAAEEDASFRSRLEAWKRASAIAMEHPVFGGGFRVVQAPSVFEKYRYREGFMGFVDTPPATFARAAHSIYFEVMSDMGFVGLGLFLAIMTSTFWLALRVGRRARFIGPSADWARELANLVTVSMAAYLVGGAALSLSYVDLPYLLVAVVVTLDVMLARQEAEIRKARMVRLDPPRAGAAGRGAHA